MADLDIVGTAAVDVVPIAPGFHDKLKAIVLPAADRVGEEAGRRLGDAMSRHITVAIPQAINRGGQAARAAATRQGDNTGGAFATSLRRKLEVAFKAMPKLDVKLGDTGVDAQLARIRAKLEQLSNKRIGIDVGAEEARAEVARLEEELRRLGANHPNPRIRVDTAAATAALAEFRAQIDAATATPGRIQLEVDGSFGAKMRAAIAEAQASLPHINVDANTSDARAELQRLREQMATLAEKRVGIDIDAATARATIADIHRRLEILSIQRHDIDVRVDAARAAAQLAALDAEADKLKLVNIKAFADTSQASGALMRLGIQMAATAAIPLGPIIAAGLGAVVAAATAAGAGIGALALAAIPAIKGVTSVIQAKSAAEKEAAKATDNSAAADKRAAQSALQMESAQQALTTAHRNAARSIAQANRAVEDAERALGQAAARAMEERRQAAEAVERAERSLSDAKVQARNAEEALTQARRNAAQQLADLNDKLSQGKLDERDATLRVQEAQAELNKTRSDARVGKATQLQLERAQLAYDQAVEAAKQQKKDYGQLQKDAEAAKKAGVNGNADVKHATDELAKAQQHVQDETKAVADAQRKAAQAQISAAQSVADAQRSLSDAVANAANTQVQAAESIKSAERGVQSARLSSMDTTVKAATKADAYRQALAKLTPEQRRLYDSIAGPKGLTSAFKDWSKSLQPDVLPLFVRGVDGAKSSLPTLTPLVKTAADAIGELMDRASADMKKPFWQGFKKDIAENAKPAIVGLGVAFGNILKGMAGIVDAFLPHMDGISDRMQGITRRFADWGTKLKGSPAFEKFLDYVKENAPRVSEMLGSLFGALFDLAKALEPASRLSMAILTPLLDGISWISEHAPWVIQLLWGLYAVHKAIQLGMAAFAVAMGIYEIAVAGATLVTAGWAAAIQATGIVPVIEAIVIAVAALALGIIWAYNNVGWFRDAVDTAWAGIKDATLFLWEKILKPAFSGIWWAIKGIGDIAVWLWQNIFVPVWNGIVLVMKYAITIILTILIAPLYLAFKGIGLLVGWLYTDCFKPTFDGIAWLAMWLWKNALAPTFTGIWWLIKWIGDKFVWLYNNAVKPTGDFIASKATWLWRAALQPTFKAIWDLLKWVGDKFTWLYDHSVKPVADFISSKTHWLYDKGIKPAFDSIRSAVKIVGDAFGSAKDAIGRAWYQVASIAAKPVNFIIDWVYNKGIKKVWDSVADFVGLDPLPKAPKLLDERPKFAQGGRTQGGTPGVDSIPILAMADEFIIKRDSARKIGFDKLAYMNATGELPGVQRFADGGVVGFLGNSWDWASDKVSSAVSKGIDWAKTAGDLIAHPSKVWNKLMKPFLDKAAKKLGVAQMGKVLLKYPLKIVGDLKDKIVDFVTGGGGGSGHMGGANIGGAIPTGQRAQIIRTAMTAAHVPPPGTVEQWLRGMNTLITRESGWDPNAINRWDSNAAAGHPSQGLTQTIPSTWSAYVPASLRSRGILDPVGNVAASIRYIVSRYGSIGNVQQANANLPPQGYAEGGRVAPTWFDAGGLIPPGLSLVANGTGSPEPVFTDGQWSDIRSAKAGTAPTTLHADVRVFVGNREITDIVDTRIEMREEASATALNTGRWV
jgi:hypothetical protein